MFTKDYARYYDLFNRHKDYQKDIKFIYKWADKPKRILDLGCGTAHYWQHYPKTVDIFGVERSEHMIKLSPYKDKIFKGEIGDTDAPNFDVDLVTAIFDVVNYLPDLYFLRDLPLLKGGYFVFDIWEKKKVYRDGFETRVREVDGVTRKIKPAGMTEESITLDIRIDDGGKMFKETHKMYFYGVDEIMECLGVQMKLDEVKKTDTWQTWYKLIRK